MLFPVVNSSHRLKTFIFGILAIFFCAGTALAGSFDFTLENAYRRDSFDWNIAGDNSGNNPNILSELTWDDIEIYQLAAEGVYRFGQHVNPPVAGCLKGRLGYGWIYAGKNQDSDYSGDNRTLEWSRSNNNADDGHVVDLLAGGGVRLTWLQGRLSLSPLAGLSYHQQKLTITDGNQTIPATGPFPGLASTYTAEWYGPWVGADLAWQPITRFTVASGVELHAVRYYAEGDWNLRSDLQHPRSFKHEGDGAGIVLSLQGQYRLIEELSLAIQGRYESWRVDDGNDTVYSADGTISGTRLNEVNHSVASLGIQFIWSF